MIIPNEGQAPTIRNASVGLIYQIGNDRFFTVARHLVSVRRSNGVGVEVHHVNMTTKGTVICSTDNVLDTSIVKVTAGADHIGFDMLAIPHSQLRFNGILDPATQQAPLQVCHAGHTTLTREREGYLRFDGTLSPDNPRMEWAVNGRTMRAGDSGGPVFTAQGTLVGFICEGGAERESQHAGVALAYHVFRTLGIDPGI